MSYRQRLSEFIVNYIKNNHLSRQEFAVLTKVSVGTINNYIQQKTEPEIILLYRMSVYTQVDVFEFIGLESTSSYTSTIEKVHKCKLLLDKIEKEVTEDFIKNSNLSMLIFTPEAKSQISLASEKELNEHVSLCIKNYVRTTGMTYSDLAEKIGINKSIISDYINCHTLPSLAIAIRMCRVMGMRLQELIGFQLAGESEIDRLYKRLLYIEDQLLL